MYTLEAHRLFVGLDAEAKEQIFGHLHRLDLSRGQALFEEQAPASTLYLVEKGWLRLYKINTCGRRSILRLAGPFSVLGFSALLQGRRTLEAQAATQCRILFWQASTLQLLLERYPRLSYNMMQLLLEYRAQLQEQLLELATEPVQQRLAHALLRLAKSQGLFTDEEGQLQLPLLQRDLAELIGASHYTVSRFLHLWQRQGLVQVRRGWLLINLRQLEAALP